MLALLPDKKHTRDVRSALVEYMSGTGETSTSLVLEPLRSFVLQRVVFSLLYYPSRWFVARPFHSFVIPLRFPHTMTCNEKKLRAECMFMRKSSVIVHGFGTQGYRSGKSLSRHKLCLKVE